MLIELISELGIDWLSMMTSAFTALLSIASANSHLNPFNLRMIPLSIGSALVLPAVIYFMIVSMT
jgi:hypothetical protein